MSSPEDIARQMEAAEKIHRTMAERRHPYHEQLYYLMRAVGDADKLVNEIGSRWKVDFLQKAAAPDKDHPGGQDYDAYATPLIVAAEMLRKQPGCKELAHRIYLAAVRLTDQHCAASGIDLHRGALYADLAITHLERKQFELGLSWLLAAANEDVRFHRIPTVYDSYALSNDGVLGQWVQELLLPAMPAAVLDFVNTQLGTAYGFPDVMYCLRSLAGHGDLNLLAGIANFADMHGRTDYIAHSVRFTCLRDLATLTEVLLKRVGVGHADAAVQGKFASGPMMANIIHHMHYLHLPGPRAANPALKAARSEGLFWNSVQHQNDLIVAIDGGFDAIKDFNTTSIADVRTYLDTHALAADANVGALAKRFLLAYRLRNETSHSFHPTAPGMVAHAEEFRLWLLQTIFYAYFWFRDTGQAAF
jgi:hypothetical protein